jgi:D-alanyl-lipoteichoic acid acyltransferase DltB (MBOAT superfamily)
MLFASNIFLFEFLPAAILGFYLLAHYSSVMAAKVWLCAASFVFYGWWNPAFLLLLGGSIVFNYTLSTFLKSDDDAPGGTQSWLLAFGVAANLGLLFYYKYLFPLLGFLHHLGVTQTDYGSVELVLGISFFTFTQIGYLVDCREGLVSERNPIDYLLFVTFFPHLIAGPILHHREVMPQFANDSTYRFRPENLGVGLTVFAFGLFKKVLLADKIAPWAEAGFAHPAGASVIQGWSVALAYSMQLYFDFSAYCDMAIGLGIMFGMTLTRYLTLLIYNPISLAIVRRRQARGLPAGRQAVESVSGFASIIVFPTMTTLLLAGIWHGAGIQFIVYGALFGTYLSINHAWRLVFPPSGRKAPQSGLVRLWRGFWPVALTYTVILVPQIFFRADNTKDAAALLSGMFGANGSGFPLPIPANDVKYLGPMQHLLLDHSVLTVALRETYNSQTLPLATNLLLAIGLAIICFTTPNVYQIMGEWSPALNKVKPATFWPLHWKPSFMWAAAAGIMMFWSCLHFDHPARFLYFQF